MRPRSSCAGGTPVVECGVRQFQNRNLESLVSSESVDGNFFILSLKHWTAALSAEPLLTGWYGDDLMWHIPLFFMKASNSALVNCGPLSVTRLRGRLCVANMECKCWIVTIEVVADSGFTSSHLEKALITTKNILPWNGPAKSACSRSQGCLGNYHGWSGAWAGLRLNCWKASQAFTFSSKWCQHILDPRQRIGINLCGLFTVTL